MSRIAAALIALALPALAQAQTVQTLNNPPPDGVEAALLLTDGRVLAQGANNSDWWFLTPDDTGSYVNGTWSQAASLPAGYAPYAMSSAVLADGRVLIEGGEYNEGQFALTNLGAVYDPVANAWSSVSPPHGWSNIGDSPSIVLPNGKFLLGKKLTKQLAELDPKNMKWRIVSSTGKLDFNAAEGWTLLPDGDILTVDVKNNPDAERYSPASGQWFLAGNTVANLQGPPVNGCMPYPPKNLCYYPPGEVGPAILMPDGSVFATGALHEGETAAHTAIRTTLGWQAGPDFPNGDQAGDEFASLLPNGHVLVEANSGTLYEFYANKLWAEPVTAKNQSMLLLPTGEVLVDGTEAYSSSGTYRGAWQPKITSWTKSITRGSSYKIFGKQFNGLSQANAFGDELQSATNYPLVRITNDSTGHVFYAKTHDHSTMSVATGDVKASTTFDVPSGMETGTATLQVVANGIPSKAVAVTVQ